MRPLAVAATAALTFLTLGGAAASAQELGLRSYGLRGGVNLNPDQFNLGGHVDAGRLTSRVRLQPSAEIGFGNGVILASANFDAHYLLSPSRIRPYVGGGFGFTFVDVKNGIGGGRGLSIEPVLNVVGGIEWGAYQRGSDLHRYLLEARVGFGDTPELKLIAGINF